MFLHIRAHAYQCVHNTHVNTPMRACLRAQLLACSSEVEGAEGLLLSVLSTPQEYVPLALPPLPLSQLSPGWVLGRVGGCPGDTLTGCYWRPTLSALMSSHVGP